MLDPRQKRLGHRALLGFSPFGSENGDDGPETALVAGFGNPRANRDVPQP